MPARADILNHLKSLLESLFEVEPDTVSEDSLLYEDLDLDSIDAVDLMVHLKDYTGRKVDPQVFKDVKTVGDVVTAVEALFDESAA